MKHVTIKDIAKELNLAISTISRAFNDKYDIRPETRQLILNKAREMGYRPNPFARNLLRQRSMNIGVVIPEFIGSFFPEIIMGAQEVLFKEGYQVLITQSNECCKTESENVKLLEQNMVDGLLISLTHETEVIDYYKDLISSGLPVVFFNRVSDQLETSKVLFDDYKWAFFATEHLIYQGYKKIFHLAGPSNLSLSGNRIRGFQDAHKKHRLEIPSSHIIPSDFMIEDGQRVAKEIIENGNIPEAIFAAGDLTAIGAMKVFKKNGYRIPEDIAFVGFSEQTIARHVDPPLTSVAQPTLEIGRTAAKLLVAQIENQGLFVPQTITLSGKLNIRSSSMRLI
ncbi:MAG: LacI family DNA-binding transcriptional regulator [Bacteroidota bacterium]